MCLFSCIISLSTSKPKLWGDYNNLFLYYTVYCACKTRQFIDSFEKTLKGSLLGKRRTDMLAKGKLYPNECKRAN